jgi:hypothetical protein
MGILCTDNLPLQLLPKLVDLYHESGVHLRQIAVGVDVRVGSLLDEFTKSLQDLSRRGITYQILFFEAQDEVIKRRFSETRRRHPLGRSVEGGLREEKRRVRVLRSLADRMDYLLRDSRQLGVNYGNYEQGRLLKSALCAVDRRFPADTLSGNPLVYRLGWRQSGLGAIENFIVARSFMFREMYAHKTYRAFELMLKRVAEVARTHEIALIECRTLDGFAEAYCRLTDDVFLRILTGEIPTGHALPEEIRELASCVMARHPWKRVYDVKRSMRGKEDAILAQLRERWPGIEFLVDRRPTRATKDLDRGSRLYDLNGEGRYSRTTADAVTNGRSWLDESAIIEGLHRDEVERLRLYAKKVSFTKEDRDMASAMRLEALKIAASL